MKKEEADIKTWRNINNKTGRMSERKEINKKRNENRRKKRTKKLRGSDDKEKERKKMDKMKLGRT